MPLQLRLQFLAQQLHPLARQRLADAQLAGNLAIGPFMLKLQRKQVLLLGRQSFQRLAHLLQLLLHQQGL